MMQETPQSNYRKMRRHTAQRARGSGHICKSQTWQRHPWSKVQDEPDQAKKHINLSNQVSTNKDKYSAPVAENKK